MKSIVKYNKNSIGEVNDTLNNKKKAEESQHYIMNIYNIDNDDHLHVERNTFRRMALIYFHIVMRIKDFSDFKMVEKQEYELRLNSQQIESLFLSCNEMTNLNLKSMEDLSLKDALQPLLNALKELLEDEE